MKEKKLQLKTIMGKFLAMLLAVVTIFSVGMPLSAKAATTTVTNGTDLKVHYFNVGDGTCVILEQNGHYMLIDTGEYDQPLKRVQNWMATNNVKKFDYVIISHYDSDHVSNLKGLLNLDKDNPIENLDANTPIKVGKFLARKYSKASMTTMLGRSAELGGYSYINNYMDFVNVVARCSGTTYDPIKSKGSALNTKKTLNAVYKKIDVYSTKKNESKELLWKNPIDDYSCEFGNGVKIKFYTLNSGDTHTTNKNILYKEAVNDDSLTFKITYKGSSFWFFNDLKQEGMKEILGRTRAADYNNSVVLMPHHGIMNNNITNNLCKNFKFKEKLTNTKIFVRSVGTKHYNINFLRSKSQDVLMKMFSKGGYFKDSKLVQTCDPANKDNNVVTISTSGRSVYNVN